MEARPRPSTHVRRGARTPRGLPGRRNGPEDVDARDLQAAGDQGYPEGTMPDYRYLIVGGGMTADAAVHGIREVDAGGSIGVIGAERRPPYDRPPLSNKLWKGESPESIWRHSDSQAVALHVGRTVQRIDLRTTRATDDRGTEYGYSKLLLATGGAPRRLPFGGDQ